MAIKDEKVAFQKMSLGQLRRDIAALINGATIPVKTVTIELVGGPYDGATIRMNKPDNKGIPVNDGRYLFNHFYKPKCHYRYRQRWRFYFHSYRSIRIR